ncbi:MAG: hypothetical protein HYY25_01820 [Candidatus Wallbacteria bacterium]|nr:hypothetical protein [Candidatus Wallbacteria bacterium]
MSRELRRNYLIRKSFQTKLILRLSLMILVTSLMVALIFIGSRYVVAIEAGNVAHFAMLDELSGLFFEVLVWWLLAYLLLFAFFALRFSHEIAGPLYRFEKALMEIADDGRLDARIRLREEDDEEFHYLADLFNRAVGRVRDAVSRAREASAGLREAATATPADAAELARRCDALDDALRQVAGGPAAKPAATAQGSDGGLGSDQSKP